MAHEGSFSGKEDREYDYEIVQWWNKEGEELPPDALTELNLYTVGELVAKIEDQESGEVSYETIKGEFENWEFVDETLEHDYGTGGSRP